MLSDTRPRPRVDANAAHWALVYEPSPIQKFEALAFEMPTATLSRNAAFSASTVRRIADRSLAGVAGRVGIVVGFAGFVVDVVDASLAARPCLPPLPAGPRGQQLSRLNFRNRTRRVTAPTQPARRRAPRSAPGT
jgi:hypothetical protein